MQDYQKIWNDRYGGGEYLFGKTPNAYFKTKLDTLTSGTLFLPGDGEGRNAVYAALKGWNVTAVDFSEIALERAKAFADLNNVKINFLNIHLIKEEIPKSEFDVLGISFLHFNGANKLIVHRKLNNSLKVGGAIILECFSEEQLKLITGGPRKKDSLYNIEELKEFYPNFRMEEIGYHKVILKEGEAHQGDAYVIRMFAKKLEDLK